MSLTSQDNISFDPARPPSFLNVGEKADARAIAYRRLRARSPEAGPGLVWLGGFKSDMEGAKATALEAYAARVGCAYVRFDYSAHGLSPGDFLLGTISRWLEESLAIIENVTQGPQILVGSSMGGWLALLAARALAQNNRGDLLAGLVLIAPAVDFTTELIEPALSAAARRELAETGRWLCPSPYGEPTPITSALLEDGARHRLFGGTIRAYAPVHILQGMKDQEVPWRHALEIMERLPDDPAALTLIGDGDHRLSREHDIDKLIQTVEGLRQPPS